MRKSVAGRVAMIVGGILIFLWCAIPVYWGLVVSLTTPIGLSAVPPHPVPDPVTFAYYRALLSGGSGVSQTFLHGAENSILETLYATLLTVVLAIPAAYAFVRFRFRGSSVLFLLIVGTLSLPVYAVLIPLFQLMTGWGLTDTYTAIAVINSSANLPLALWLLRSHIAALPVDIEDAARIDGASRSTTVTRILLPLIAPGLATVAVIVFLSSWSAFLVPLAFAPTIKAEPLTVIVTQYASKYAVDYGLQAAAGVLAMLPPAVFVAWFNRHILSGLISGAVNA
ncbi:MAG: carbohydrate ABC transporter permease [Firmicutes bacterium]|nr:carbohydrate ABC transporter permease [Bacillota bacterium]